MVVAWRVALPSVRLTVLPTSTVPVMVLDCSLMATKSSPATTLMVMVPGATVSQVRRCSAVALPATAAEMLSC